MGQVANTKTPLTYGQALGALLAAGCPQSALLMVGAQSAVETAGWKSCVQWNMGNVTITPSQIAAGVPWMNQGLQGMKFIAFPDAVSGAKAMLDWLAPRGLLARATANDLTGYVALLESQCYAGCVGRVDGTGHTVSQQDYDNYRAGLASWMSKLNGVTPEAPPGKPFSLPYADLALAAAGLLALGGLGWLAYREWKRPGELLPWRAYA